MLFAMIVNNTVIEIVTADAEPKWPPTPDGIIPLAIECDVTVKRGMIYDDGEKTFSYPLDFDQEKNPTQLDNIESGINTLLETYSVMDVLLGVDEYEA